MSATLTVIIPTYNRTDLLGPCLDSLNEQTYRDFSVIVVDDGSDVDVARFVKDTRPDVLVLRRKENGGFAKAVNTGLQAATSELLLLLNNDITLEPNALERLVDGLNASGAHMAAPLMVFAYEPHVVYGCGDRQWRGGRPASIGYRAARDTFKAKETPFGVSAGAGLYRAEVFDRCGLLDEAFIAYFEDSDLNFRARLAGFETVCVPEAVLYHVGSASLDGRTWWRTRQCFRNHALLVWKDMPLGLMLRFAPAIVAERRHQLFRFYTAGRAEFGLMGVIAEHLRVTGELLGLMGHVLRERRRIQRDRRMSLRDLAGLLRAGRPE